MKSTYPVSYVNKNAAKLFTSTCHALPSAWTTRSSIGRLQFTH